MRLLPVLAVVIALLVPQPVHAADPVRVDIVAVDEEPGRMWVTVGVLGPNSKPLSDLIGENFRVSLNDEPVAVAEVSTAAEARVHSSVLLVVDASGSMQGAPIEQARAAMHEFIDGLDPEDDVAVLAFSTRVGLLQEFTPDRDLLAEAIDSLVPAGDTALFDGVIEATQLMAAAPPGRRMIVLLSDGLATSGLTKRAASLTAARTSGATVVVVGLGASLDRAYLNEVSATTGGRFLEASTPAALREAYADLAATIRNQYTIVVKVPDSVDRTQPTKLAVSLSVRAGTGRTERELEPLEGAAPPPFDLAVKGLASGKPLGGPATLTPQPVEGVAFTTVEYSVDGKVVHAAAEEPFAYEIDPAGLKAGNHIVRVIAIDEAGRRGETQMSFSVAAPAPPDDGPSVAQNVLLMVAAGSLAVAIGGGILIARRRQQIQPERAKPWSGRTIELSKRIEDWPEPARRPPVPPPVEDRPLGRVVVMDEAAMREGNLDSIREYEIRSNPLTFGSGASCDIQVGSDGGRIAAEEARLWVQRGRLVYHKLTTLSAMATEGVTSGWEFLDSGEEIKIGPYRLLFDARPANDETQPEEPERPALPQEHGMGLRELWNRRQDDPSLRPFPE